MCFAFIRPHLKLTCPLIILLWPPLVKPYHWICCIQEEQIKLKREMAMQTWKFTLTPQKHINNSPYICYPLVGVFLKDRFPKAPAEIYEEYSIGARLNYLKSVLIILFFKLNILTVLSFIQPRFWMKPSDPQSAALSSDSFQQAWICYLNYYAYGVEQGSS